MDLLEFFKRRSSDASNEDELLYEFVATELEQGAISKGLWTKALAERDFDERLARAHYVQMRVGALRDELKQIVPQLAQLRRAQSQLAALLEQGCTQDAIDYLGSPSLAAGHIKKYGSNMEGLKRAISVGRIKGCLVDGYLWVQDRRI